MSKIYDFITEVVWAHLNCFDGAYDYCGYGHDENKKRVAADVIRAFLAEAAKDGWEMKPSYASNEMALAAIDRKDGTGTMYHDIWAAMFDAAPKIEGGE